MMKLNKGNKKLQTAVLFLAVISLIISLYSVYPSVSMAEDTNQQGWYDGTVERTNPFPDAISDQEVKDNTGKKAYIYKYRVTEPGQAPKVYSSFEDVGHILPTGTKVEILAALLPVSNTNIRYTLNDNNFFSFSLSAVNDDPSQGLARKGEQTYNYEDQKLNNEPLVFMPGTYRFSFKQITTPQYLSFAYTVKEPLIKMSQFWGLDKISNGPGNFNVSTSWARLNTWFSANAHFHYVNEYDYRQARGLKLEDKITQRSEATPAFSNAAFSSYDIKDLAQSKTTTGYFYLKSNSNSDMKFPILRPDGEPPAFSKSSDKGTHYQFEGAMYPTVINQLKPTLGEVTSNKLKGYVYATNDIDLPTGHDTFANDDATLKDDGNHYLSMSLDKNKNALTDKHYYIMERPIATPVVLQKTDAKTGKALKDAKFTLEVKDLDGNYKKVPGEYVTDDKGEIKFAGENATYSELEKITSEDKENKGYILSGKKLYFIPGLTYRVTESEAPKGYKKADAFEFTAENKAISAENENDIVAAQTIKITDEQETPNKPTGPTNPEKPANPSNPDKPTTPATIEGPKAPNTGDSERLFGFAVIAMMSGALLTSLSGRKQDDKNN